MATQCEDWISIAQQVTAETNPAKLIALVDQLCCALDNRKRTSHLVPRPKHELPTSN
jgi:hypothetical protein